jgi:DNA-binding NarL/FixJ family response regulator
MPSAKTPNARRSRVLIVDDHPLVRHGLAALVAGDPRLEVCGQAADPIEAMRLVESSQPDVILIDLSLGSSSGLELIKQVKASAPHVRMLVSSMHDERLYAERALRAGAMGYVHKQSPLISVIDAIHQVLQGAVYISQQMADRMLHRVVHGDGQRENSPLERLTDRELEVFSLIGEGLTTRQVAERLHLSPKTIETHRDHIKAKLKIATNNELVRHAVEWAIQEA